MTPTTTSRTGRQLSGATSGPVVTAIAVAAVVLLSACAVENGDSGDSPDTSETDDPSTEVTDEEPNEGALVVYVYAENGVERTYYEEFKNAFQLDTGLGVDLEVRLP